MKKIILYVGALAFLTLPSSIQANWQDHWKKAVEYCESKSYQEAEAEFNLSVAALESDKDDTHPHVFVDRARLYLLQNRYDESLADLDKVIDSEHLTDVDKIRGLVTRIFTCSNLQMGEQVLKDYAAFKAMSSDFPKVEFSKKQIVIRNIPKSNCYKKLVKAFLLATSCESENDIVELNSGIMIAKKKECKSDCHRKTCPSPNFNLYDHQTIPPAYQNRPNNGAYGQPNIHATYQSDIDGCKWWCDKCTLGGIAWCAKVFKLWHCQTACIFAVDLIKDGCHWCCKEGNFYEKCVEPFEDILARMTCDECDPYWD
jgi:tetratricopeptide (TPR) repeat protein